MTHLSDLFALADLGQAIRDGYVREQWHPNLPMRILNYSERATYERAWTPVTLHCRGLIADAEGRIVARPFSKFFNYGEHPDGTFDLAEPAEVTNKLDGSLGITYPAPGGGWMLATRGSFTSEQAAHGSLMLHNRYPDFEPPEGMTVLFEIVYPANRVVLDYGVTDDLFLLGAVDIATGRSTGPHGVPAWTGPVAETLAARSLAGALAMEPRESAEGVVVRLVATGTRIKIKQDDYLQAHAIVTRTSTKTVWEALSSGKGLRLLADFLPDEFLAWAEKVAADLTSAKDAWLAEAQADFERTPKGADRKAFALEAIRSPYRAALFRLYDDRSIDDMAWKAVRPEYERPYYQASEDVA